MAGELRGAILEALVFYSALKSSAKHKLQPEWGTNKVTWLSVVPDILLKDENGELRVLILVTASDSSSDANRKFWRNFIELAEAKAENGSEIVVVDVTYEHNEKLQYESVRDFLYDSRILPKSKIERKVFFEFCDNLEKNLSPKASSKTCLAELLKLDGELKKKLEFISSNLMVQIVEASNSKNSRLKSMWEEISSVFEREKALPPIAKITTVTRGVGKCLILNSEERTKLWNLLNHKIRIKDLPSELVSLKLFLKTMSGYKLADEDVRNCFELIGSDSIENIINATPYKKYSTYVTQIRQIGVYEKIIDLISKNKKFLSSEKNLAFALEYILNDQFYLWEIKESIKFHWLFDGLLAIYRALNNNKMSGFYNQIEIYSIIPKSVQRYHYPRFIRLEDILPSKLLISVSIFFSKMLTSLSENDFTIAKNKIKESMLQNILECKLIPHGSRPLQRLLESKLENTKYENTKPSPISCFLGENDYFLSTEGYLFDKSCVITKSVTEMGRNHKVKELCSKAIALRLKLNSSGKITKNNNIENLFLIADGTYRKEDFMKLIRAGFDGIFYPDQIDALVDKLICK